MSTESLDVNKKPEPRNYFLSLKSEEEKKDYLQIGKEGISHDYYNNILPSLMDCRKLIGKSRKKVEEHQRKEVMENLISYLGNVKSYSEYILYKPFETEYLLKYLTEKGKEILKRLDEIIKELKLLILTDLSQSTLNQIEKLLKEA